jgi:hypothetical protein
MPKSRRLSCRAAALLAVAVCLVGGARSAAAEDNDLVMQRLGTAIDDGAGTVIDVVGDNQQYRSMVSELGVVLAPRLLSPADTIGFGGFHFSADFGFTGISNDEPYWRVLESSDDPVGGTGVHGSSLMQTVGVFMRKGMWFPLPSFEVGAGVVHLMDSSLWAAQGYAKFALHEGYHDLPIPSVAVRGAGSRMMGSQDIDLTVASFDVSVSKLLGLAGTMRLEPYGGWNLLVIVPRSEVLDKTPQTDGDIAANFVFKDQQNIFRHRLFGGMKLQYYVFSITLEAAFALAGSSVDDRSGTDVPCSMVTDPSSLGSCDAEDMSKVQESFNLSMGLDF